MRFGEEDDAGDAARRRRSSRGDEAMEELADGAQASALDSAEADRSQRRGLGHQRPSGSAAVQVGSEMEALHRADYPAL
jgi:hypothetical protein